MYDFRQLSPLDFEELVRDLLQEEWGVRLESFKSGRDQGIDLRYTTEPLKKTIIQCKRYVGSPFSKLLNDLRTGELPKINKLSPERYVLVTALPLNPNDKDEIFAALMPHVRSLSDIYGADDINNLLGLHKNIESKHFKLWLSSTPVLERVLHNAEVVQTEFDVERVRRSIPLYVQNKNFTASMKILDANRFVIVSGVPGIGKTTLADMLLFAHLEAGYEPVVIQSDIKEGKKLFKKGQRQIFYFDDFLGETFLGNRLDFLAKNEDAAVLDFLEMVARSDHARMILTVREHILQHAFQISERFRRNQFELSERRCVLEIGSYSKLDRARILYNHIYFSDLPELYREALLSNRFYLQIVNHTNFNPRLVEWLSKYANVKAVSPQEFPQEVRRVLDNPEQLWRMAFQQQISESSRSVLLALYSLGGNSVQERLEQAWDALHKYRADKYNWQRSPEDFRRSLKDLEGGFLKYDSFGISFVNPSVKDFFDGLLGENLSYLNDLLAASILFVQVETIWALATSERGAAVMRKLQDSPADLVAVSKKKLEAPYERRKYNVKGGGYTIEYVDLGPEGRLATIISIADRVQSLEAVELAEECAGRIRVHFKEHYARYGTLVRVLSLLDKISWQPLKDLDLSSRLKEMMFADAKGYAGSDDLEHIAKYSDETDANWTDEDRDALTAAFESYLEDRFNEEFSNCSDESEYSGLADSLSRISSSCDVEADPYIDDINEKISEFEEPDYDDDGGPRNWSPSQPARDVEEVEVDRLFDSMKSG